MLRFRLLIVFTLIGVLAGCGSTSASTVSTDIPATEAVVAATTTATLVATLTPKPAETSTPRATNTPRPSRTPTQEAPSATATTEPSAEPTASSVAEPTVAADSAAAVVAGANIPTRLVIDAVNIDEELVSVGLDANRVPVVPNHDVGWYNLSARPGQGENIVLWGHVLRFKATPNIPAPFARLKDVAVGETITLYAADGVARQYRVTEQIWATPDQVEYILPRGEEMLTLVSCIGDKVVVDESIELSHRLITVAKPIN